MTPRRALRELLLRALSRYRPLYPADPERGVRPLTLAELEEACGWGELRAEGRIEQDLNPLDVTGLRFSRLFPRHLLHTREDGKVVTLGLSEAVDLVLVELEKSAPAANEH